MGFASVDLDKLEQADSAIRSAADGQGLLSSTYSIPPGVAVAIAANELEKKGFPSSYQANFMKNFELVWGRDATNELSKTLSLPPEKYDPQKMWVNAPSMENKPKLEER